MNGFIYPNEAEINWGLFIVLYPYLTGLVAGAFIVSSLYHVFGVSKLKPVSRLALIAALAVLLVAPHGSFISPGPAAEGSKPDVDTKPNVSYGRVRLYLQLLPGYSGAGNMVYVSERPGGVGSHKGRNNGKGI